MHCFASFVPKVDFWCLWLNSISIGIWSYERGYQWGNCCNFTCHFLGQITLNHTYMGWLLHRLITYPPIKSSSLKNTNQLFGNSSFFWTFETGILSFHPLITYFIYMSVLINHNCKYKVQCLELVAELSLNEWLSINWF